MDKSLLEEYRERCPNRRIIFLDKKREYYDEEYARFNMDILKQFLEETTLEYELLDTQVRIKGGKEIFKALLFECAIFGKLDEQENVVFLKLYTTATDIMSVACRLLKIFKKSLD